MIKFTQGGMRRSRILLISAARTRGIERDNLQVTSATQFSHECFDVGCSKCFRSSTSPRLMAACARPHSIHFASTLSVNIASELPIQRIHACSRTGLSQNVDFRCNPRPPAVAWTIDSVHLRYGPAAAKTLVSYPVAPGDFPCGSL